MQRLPTLVLLSCALASAAAFAEAPGASVWPQWRGPQRDGVFHGKAWPGSLSRSHLEEVWSVKLGQGYPGPVVTADRVFTVESAGGHEIVRAFDRRSGRPVWTHRWEGAMIVPFFAWSNGSWVRATPAWDGARLYVAGMRDVLECIEGATGKSVWRKDFVREFGTPLPAFGFVCSPLVTDAHVYVQAGASVVKLDKLTGRVAWRTLKDEGGMYGSAFASPVIADLAGTRQLVVKTRKAVAGVDPGTGAVLWSKPIKAFRGMNILTPTLYGDAVLTSTYGGTTQLHAVRKQDGAFAVETVWTAALQGYMTSPIVIDKHAYLHLRNQRFACVNLETGGTAWVSESRFGQYCSLVRNGEHILALDQQGELLLIRATPKAFDLVGRAKVSEEPTWAHLAVCDDCLFVRALTGLTVYRWRP